MKNIICILLSLSMICITFAGCSSAVSDANNADEPLTICVDVGFHSGPAVGNIERGAKMLANSVASHSGLENVELEIIPGSGAARESALTRIRTEIMSGKGPDVFICCCVDTSIFGQGEKALFPFPEKTMNDGLFLPLDKYIEKAQYMEWEKLQPEIMEAGKSGDKQYILPISFALPITAYEAEETGGYPVTTAFPDVMTSDDPVLRSTGAYTYCCDIQNRCSFPFIFTDYADYSTESLRLTEEELYQSVKEVIQLKSDSPEDLPPHFSEQFTSLTYAVTYSGADPRQGLYASTKQTMLPLYNLDGGATAVVCSFGAVSAATKQPENAFLVLDLLLSRFMHRDCELYACLCGNSMPSNMEMGEDRDRVPNQIPPYKINGCKTINPEAFASFAKAREQISYTRFSTVLDHELTDLILSCSASFVASNDELIREKVAAAYTKMNLLLAES